MKPAGEGTEYYDRCSKNRVINFFFLQQRTTFQVLQVEVAYSESRPTAGSKV